MRISIICRRETELTLKAYNEFYATYFRPEREENPLRYSVCSTFSYKRINYMSQSSSFTVNECIAAALRVHYSTSGVIFYQLEDIFLLDYSQEKCSWQIEGTINLTEALMWQNIVNDIELSHWQTWMNVLQTKKQPVS